MALIDIVNKWRTERSKAPKVIVADKVASEAIKSPHRIPEYEKPFSQLYVDLYVEKPKVVVVTEVVTADMFKAWLRGFMSKNPNYKLLKKTKCSFSNNKPYYWFLDTSRNVTVIMSKSEINQRLKL